MFVHYLDSFLQNSWILYLVLSALFVLVLIIILTRLAERLRLMDEPSHRKQHAVAVPLVGGLAIYIVLLGALVVIPLPNAVSWVIGAASAVVAVGALDDVFGLGVKSRLVIQAVATLIVIFGSGIQIEQIVVGIFDYSEQAQWLALPVTVFAVVGLTNGFNLIDGVDGLAAGQALVGFLSVLAALQVFYGSIHQMEWMAVLIGAVFIFFLINISITPLRKVFLGDAGSLLLGFSMAWTLIYYTQKPMTLFPPVVALWCVIYPVMDVVFVISQRIFAGDSPFRPDRNHLHHKLQDLGYSNHGILGITLSATCLVNAFGIWLTYEVSSIVSLITYVCVISSFLVGGCFLVRRKQVVHKGKTN